METHRRLFTVGQRDFLRHRDQYCATLWCGAPIRHADHVVPAARGGPTRLDNGRGQCEACNHAGQAPGWHSRPLPDGGIQTITPTAHRYVQPPRRPFAPSTSIKVHELDQRLAALCRVGRLGPAA